MKRLKNEIIQKFSARLLLTSVLASNLAILAGCTTTQTTPESSPAPQAPVAKKPQGMDLATLQRALRMDRSPRELGYEEKAFNPCDFGLSTKSCAPQHLIVVHFLVQCRDSEGTVESVAASEITPLYSDNVKWNLGSSLEGRTQTDRDGYGEIRLIAASSQAKQRLRITANGKFLAQTAQDMKRVVAPKAMCQGN
jgi:hypothetical protein